MWMCEGNRGPHIKITNNVNRTNMLRKLSKTFVNSNRKSDTI